MASSFLSHFRLCGGVALQLIDDITPPSALDSSSHAGTDFALFDGAICRSRDMAVAWLAHVEAIQPGRKQAYRVGFLEAEVGTRTKKPDALHLQLMDMLFDEMHPNWLPLYRTSNARRAVA
jgi:hypothetical protein